MLIVDVNGNIQLTRGDTARLSVTIDNELTGSPYEIGPSDVMKLTVKKNSKLPDFLFQKVITGSCEFHIEPEDTSSIPFGKYEYDVELTTASGDVYTVIGYDPLTGTKTFELLKEVTW